MIKEPVINNVHSAKIFGRLVPVDFVTLLYILISAAYMCFGAPYLQNMGSHFVVRAGILIVMFTLVYLHKKNPTTFISFLRYMYPLIFLSYFYTETSYLKNIIFDKNLDPLFCDIEIALWGCQPSLVFPKAITHPLFNELMNMCYFSYYWLALIYCFSVHFKNNAQSYKSVFVIIFSFYLYYVIFSVFPSAGPQFHFGNSEAEYPYFFGKIMHYILDNAEEPTGAFPSSHVGIALILCYEAFKYQKRIFYWILPFTIGICFATVYLKAHYLVDVVGGIITVPIFIFISNFVYRKLQPLCFKEQ